MLKLFIAEQDGTIQSPSVPLRWCIDKEALESLKKRNALQNPHLLIAVTQNKREVSRHLIPLDDMMFYLPFYRSGKNLIQASIVTGEKVKDKFLKKSGGDYTRRIIGYDDGKLWDGLERTELEVVVPKNIFAKKPFDWRWVNLWSESKPKDQCQFRSRRFLAYTIQPIAVPAWLILKLVINIVSTLFLMMCGMRHINFKPLAHLWNCDIADIWGKVEFKPQIDSVFLRNKNGNTRYYAIPLAPVFWTPIYFLFFYFGGSNSVGEVSSLTTNFSVKLAFIFLAIKWLDLFCDWAGSKMSPSFRKFKKERNEAEARERAKKLLEEREEKAKVAAVLEQELEELLCTNRKIDFTPKIEALPSKKRTVHLRFLRAKSKVCRTFPQ